MQISGNLFSVRTIGLGILLLFLYAILTALYHLLLSPLRKFPGPKLAACTFWYEFYYDVIKDGQYTFRIARMHEQYGPVIRINPHEVHVKTPEFYDILHSSFKHRRNKWPRTNDAFGIPDSTFGTEKQEAHRMRRSAIAPFFSMSRVRMLEPVIRERAQAVLGRLNDFAMTGEVVRIDHYFTAYTTDIMVRYCFGMTDDRVNAKDFDGAFHQACLSGCKQLFVSRQFPILLEVTKRIPGPWMMKLNPHMTSFFIMQKKIGQLVAKVCQTDRSARSELGHSTLVHELVDSKLPDSDKSISRLAQESGFLLAAGTVTTSWTATIGVFWLLREPEVLRKLKQELAAALPPNLHSGDKTLLSVLEGLPYLAAVTQEMLRLGQGILTRVARVAPDEDLLVPGTEFVIPKGTAASMSHYFLNLDPGLFPQPHRFWPDRWIGHPELPQFSFGRGSRACLGRDLSLAESYLLLAFMFRTFGSREVRLEDDVGFLELFETDESDIDCACDSVVVQPKRDSKGVRIKAFTW